VRERVSLRQVGRVVDEVCACRDVEEQHLTGEASADPSKLATETNVGF